MTTGNEGHTTIGRDAAGARRARRLIIAAVALAVIGNIVTFAVTWSRQTPKRFATLAPGVLYRSAQPTAAQVGFLAEEYGIRTIVIARSGDSERLAAERRAAARAKVAVVQIPIESRGALEPGAIETFFSIVDDPERRPVLVHCAAGRHRTGILCALYRVRRQGWPAERARAEMLSFGFDVDDHQAVLNQFDELTRPTTD